MKKCVLFLINGLGIEKPGSYSISIDQIMPQLSRVKETSYFTTAITSSLEYRDAYQRFFLGDTYRSELEYIHNNVLNESLVNNQVYQEFVSRTTKENCKIHIFLEPTNDKIVDELNTMVKTLQLTNNQKVYLHLILSNQTLNEYDKIISIVNYIKFHLHSNINLGFIMGKEFLPQTLTKNELDYIKRLYFMCSAERWTETEVKLQNLKAANIRPCLVQGFCANNECFISNGDTIFFFNTRREDYDNLIEGITQMAPQMFKEEVNLSYFSLIKLNTKFNIPSFIDNIVYQNSLSQTLEKYQKKALIITDQENIKIVNFYANGLNSINNPNINFILKDDKLYQKEYIEQLIDTTPYDLIIFDYQMDTTKTVNHLKEQLSKIDSIIGLIADICVNKYSLIVTSLYGLKKELPVADYNSELVLINYEMQIPIFFFDYNYPKGKYYLAPGETNDILSTALHCITDSPDLYSLMKEKGLISNLLKAFK